MLVSLVAVSIHRYAEAKFSASKHGTKPSVSRSALIPTAPLLFSYEHVALLTRCGKRLNSMSHVSSPLRCDRLLHWQGWLREYRPSPNLKRWPYDYMYRGEVANFLQSSEVVHIAREQYAVQEIQRRHRSGRLFLHGGGCSTRSRAAGTCRVL